MSDSSVEYYFADTSASRVGPLSEEAFLQKLTENIIRPETPVWRTGESEWQPFAKVAGKWFPPADSTIPPPLPERISADTSIRSIFATAWNILFSGSNALFLIAGGFLWILIESVADSILPHVVSLFIAPLITIFVFLIFTRRWDCMLPTSFNDLFPLKQFFFKPWLRSLGAHLFSELTLGIPVGIVLAFFAIAGIHTYKTDETFRENFDAIAQIVPTDPVTGTDAPLESNEIQNNDDSAPPADDGPIVFDNPDVITLDSSDAHLLAVTFLDYLKTIPTLASILFEKPVTWVCLGLSVPFILLSFYLKLRLSFAPFLALDTELGVFASIKNSWKLSSGHVIKIACVFILQILLLLVGGILTLGIGFIFLIPYSYLCSAVLYVKFVKSRPELEIPPSRI